MTVSTEGEGTIACRYRRVWRARDRADTVTTREAVLTGTVSRWRRSGGDTVSRLAKLSPGLQVRDRRPSARLLCRDAQSRLESPRHDFGYVVRMIGKGSRTNGAKPHQFDGIAVGTMRPKLDRGPRSTRARPRRLTIEWE